MTVSLPALIRSQSSWPGGWIRTDAEHAVFRLQNHFHARRNIIRDHGRNADAEIDVVAVPKFLRDAARDAFTRVHWALTRSPLDFLVVVLALHNALDVNARRSNMIGIDGAWFHQFLHFGDGNLRRRGHHRD